MSDTPDTDDDIQHLMGRWSIEFHLGSPWTTQCEACDAPVVITPGLYPQRNLTHPILNPTPEDGELRHAWALCDACAEREMPERFVKLCEARDRHMDERPIEDR